MADVAVVAHAGKSLGGGLPELREILAREGVTDPLRYEVNELGVVTARNPVDWARTLGRLALGHPDQSPFVKVTTGKKITIRFDRKVRYELDGGARPAARKLRIRVRPASITICVPPARSAVIAPRAAAAPGS